MNSDMNSDISEKLSNILSDPSSLSKIMNIASGLFGSQTDIGPNGSAMSVTDTVSQADAVPVSQRQPTSQPRSTSPSAEKTSAVQQSAKFQKGDRRCDLLNAIKPFLSQERASRVDMLIRAMQISVLLKNTKNSNERR